MSMSNMANSDSLPGPEGMSHVSKPKVELRNYFPETWLFEMVDVVGSNGYKW